MPRHRTQLLLEPAQYRAVADLAAARKRPISEIVRGFIDLGLAQVRQERERRLAILDELAALRTKVEARSGPYPGDLVAEARAEREAQSDAVISRKEPR